MKQAKSGLPNKDVCSQDRFSDPTLYKWRAKYGGMEADVAGRLKDLEFENARLKTLPAKAHHDLKVLKINEANEHYLTDHADLFPRQMAPAAAT